MTLTLTEVAAVLNLSATTLRVQIRKGKLKAKKRGWQWYVEPEEVERYRKETLGKRRKKAEGKRKA